MGRVHECRVDSTMNGTMYSMNKGMGSKIMRCEVLVCEVF